jgi:acyl carrier protein
MLTQEQLFEQVRGTLVELFELAPERVQLDSRLFDDLDIDSLDAIDLMITLKDLTGRKVQPEQFRHVRTVRDVVMAVHALMRDENVA